MEKECVYDDSRGIMREIANFAWQQKRGDPGKVLEGVWGNFLQKVPPSQAFKQASGQAFRRASQSQPNQPSSKASLAGLANRRMALAIPDSQAISQMCQTQNLPIDKDKTKKYKLILSIGKNKTN